MSRYYIADIGTGLPLARLQGVEAKVDEQAVAIPSGGAIKAMGRLSPWALQLLSIN